ncbi:MAG TPA: DUF4136 domain-containing protein [Candidatus Acidoferrum sp.]|jgi:hypothetical protein
MKRDGGALENRGGALRVWMGLVILLLAGLPATAKVEVDFNPELDFSRFKTYAYIGGVEQLAVLQLNPELINDRVHRSVQRELNKKGLREVQPNESPDLVVRYWANSQVQVNVAATGNWGPYGPYLGTYWGFMYDTMSAWSIREGMLVLDLIDAKNKDLAWRLYLVRKIVNVEKDWKKAKKDFNKGFESYPPSAKQIEDKKKERANEKPKPE